MPLQHYKHWMYALYSVPSWFGLLPKHQQGCYPEYSPLPAREGQSAVFFYILLQVDVLPTQMIVPGFSKPHDSCQRKMEEAMLLCMELGVSMEWFRETMAAASQQGRLFFLVPCHKDFCFLCLVFIVHIHRLSDLALLSPQE